MLPFCLLWRRVKTDLPCVDGLLSNAGLNGNTKFQMTEDNEESITTMVVSTALLAYLLHPKLSETAKSFKTQTHSSFTASELYQVAKFKERKVADGQIFATLNDKDKVNMGDRYNVSKLLGMFVTRQLAAMSPVVSSGVIVNCTAPGFVS